MLVTLCVILMTPSTYLHIQTNVYIALQSSRVCTKCFINNPFSPYVNPIIRYNYYPPFIDKENEVRGK